MTAVSSVALLIITGMWWHISTMNKLNEKFKELELKQKDLERTDALQQQTINQLKELFPAFVDALNKIGHNKAD